MKSIRYRLAIWARLWLYRRMTEIALHSTHDYDRVIFAGSVRGNLYILTEHRILVFDPNRYGEKFDNAEASIRVERYLS